MRLILPAMLLLLLTGCGLKDDLYLPDASPDASDQSRPAADDGDEDAEDT
jgi:predicted small lipoprotein YifL